MLQVILISTILAASSALTELNDRRFEGDWYVNDDTDNNSGERTVYAFTTYLQRNGLDYVTLTMRCSKEKPTFFIEWVDLTFPSQAVITIGPVIDPDVEPAERQYIFQKSNDTLERGLKASPEVSADIIAAFGTAKHSIVTAHLTSGTRTIQMEIDGTQRAWERVSRHCPIKKWPQPSI